MNKVPMCNGSFFRGVQFWIVTVIVVFLLGLVDACKKENALETNNTSDSSNVINDNSSEDSSTSAVTKSDNDESSAGDNEHLTGIFNDDSKGFARAVGKAPLSRDINLARDNAAASARQNLLTLLKENGYRLDLPDTLQGATIERYWKKGKYLYAESVIPLTALSSAKR